MGVRAMTRAGGVVGPTYEIRQSVLDAPLFSGKSEFEFLSAADREAYFKDSWLYVAAKLLPDLKYSGLEMQRHTGPFGIAYMYPDPHWIDFFRGLRGYLQYPAINHRDPIAQHLRSGELPAAACNYLGGLYEPK